MQFKSNYLFLFFIFLASCQTSKPTEKPKTISAADKEKINHLLNFFNENAYQPKLQTYYSEINNEGQTISQKIYNVALSRLVYGLSYASSIHPSNLEKAQQAVDFQIKNLTAQDSLGGYFISYFDASINSADTSPDLDIWQQAYGLCGLSELYRQQPSKELLATIHQLHDTFVQRFHDKVNGGFYGNYNIKTGAMSGSKTLQALVYPVTAYMENLWLADVANRKKYEPYLKENLSIAYEKGYDRKQGWVNIKFDDEWKVCKHPAADSLCFTVTPGHNFQFASLLLRTKNWDFLTAPTQEKYKGLGIEILTRTLNQDIYPAKDLSKGFYSEVNPMTNQVLDSRKTWWQHCEALIALSLAGEEFESQLSTLEKFYFEAFMDKQNGGEFFYLDKNDNPQTNELKGSIGKSAYHTVEMIRFLERDKSK